MEIDTENTHICAHRCLHRDTEPSWDAPWAGFTLFCGPESETMRDGGTGKMALQVDIGSEAALSHFQNKDTHNQVK